MFRVGSSSMVAILLLIASVAFSAPTSASIDVSNLGASAAEEMAFAMAYYATGITEAFIENSGETLWAATSLMPPRDDVENKSFVMHSLKDPLQTWREATTLNATKQPQASSLCNRTGFGNSRLLLDSIAYAVAGGCNNEPSGRRLSFFGDDSLLQVGAMSRRKVIDCQWLQSKNKRFRFYSSYSYVCLSCTAQKTCIGGNYAKCRTFSHGSTPLCYASSFGGSPPKKCLSKYSCRRPIDYYVADFKGQNACYNATSLLHSSSDWWQQNTLSSSPSTANQSELLVDISDSAQDPQSRCGASLFLGGANTNKLPRMLVSESNTTNDALYLTIRPPNGGSTVGAALATPLEHVTTVLHEYHSVLSQTLAAKSDHGVGSGCLAIIDADSGYLTLAESNLYRGQIVSSDDAQNSSLCNDALVVLAAHSNPAGTATHKLFTAVKSNVSLWAQLTSSDASFVLDDQMAPTIGRIHTGNVSANVAMFDWGTALERLVNVTASEQIWTESSIDLPALMIFSVQMMGTVTQSQSRSEDASGSATPTQHHTRTASASEHRSASASLTLTEPDEDADAFITNTSSLTHSSSASEDSQPTGTPTVELPPLPTAGNTSATSPPTTSQFPKKSTVTLNQVFADENVAEAVTTTGEATGLMVSFVVPSTGAYAIRSSIIVRTYDCSANDLEELDKPPRVWFPIQVPLTDSHLKWYIGSAMMVAVIAIFVPLLIFVGALRVLRNDAVVSHGRRKLVSFLARLSAIVFIGCSVFFTPAIAGVAMLVFAHPDEAGGSSGVIVILVAAVVGAVLPLLVQAIVIVRQLPRWCHLVSASNRHLLVDRRDTNSENQRAKKTKSLKSTDTAGCKYSVVAALEPFIDAVEYLERILSPVDRDDVSSESSSSAKEKSSSSSSSSSSISTNDSQPSRIEGPKMLLLRRCYLLEEQLVSIVIACCGNIRPTTLKACNSTLSLMLLVALFHCCYLARFRPYDNRVEQVAVYLCAVLQLAMVLFAVIAVQSDGSSADTFGMLVEVCDLAQFAVFVVQVFVEGGMVYVRHQRRTILERMRLAHAAGTSSQDEDSSDEENEETAASDNVLSIPLLDGQAFSGESTEEMRNISSNPLTE